MPCLPRPMAARITIARFGYRISRGPIGDVANARTTLDEVIARSERDPGLDADARASYARQAKERIGHLSGT